MRSFGTRSITPRRSPSGVRKRCAASGPDWPAAGVDIGAFLHAPDLKVRVINVVDLMKLQPSTEHPHGLTDHDFNVLFTVDKPIDGFSSHDVRAEMALI